MIHAIDLFDVFDGLVGNLPGRSRRYGEIGFEPGIHQRIDRSLRRRGHHAQTADNRHSHEQGGCGVGRATFRTRNVTLRETPGHGEDLRWQPAEHRAAVDTYAGPATITPITASAAPIPSGQPTAILLSAFHGVGPPSPSAAAKA